MIAFPFCAAALWAGLFPSLAAAEVCFRGGHGEVFWDVETESNGESYWTKPKPPLIHCNIQFSFEDSFGISGVYVNNLPSLTKSGSGRPHVGIELGHREIVDVLEASSQKIGKNLNVAVTEFEASLREDISSGAYTEFLESGGSLYLWLSVRQKIATEDPVGFGFNRVNLIDFEIDSPKDCEAL